MCDKMTRQQLGEYLWFLLGDRAADNGITVNSIPYDKVDSHMQFYMEDIAEHILMRQLDERMANMVKGGLFRFSLSELKTREDCGYSIQDALNKLLQRGSV